MSLEFFLARKISFQSGKSFSKIIIRISIAAIALSVATMVISDCVVTGFQDEIKNKISGFASHIQLGNVGSNLSYENQPVKRNNSLEKNLSSNKRIASFQVYATKPGIIKTESDIEGAVLKGVENKYNWKLFKENLVSGHIPVFEDSNLSNEVLISQTMARKLSIKLGDKINIFFIQQPPKVRQLQVCGIYNTNVEDVDKLFLICDIKQIQRLNGWQNNEVGGYEIYVTDFNKIEEINEEVRLGTELELDTRTIMKIYPQIFDWLNLLNDNITIILTLMGGVAIINMITALLIMIFEKSQTIGLLKALGASNWKVQKIFIFNTVVIIFTGILLGNVLGIGIMFIQQHYHILKLDPESYYLSIVPVSFNLLHLILINLAGLVFCSIASLIPSALVISVRPSKTLRFE